MKVKLITATPEAENIISYCARVSNPSNQDKFDTAPKLLGYLIKHKHWSPFEHASLTVEIQTSRGIASQILRHRSFVFQEYSQRYALSQGYEQYPARRQDEKNRQNSIDDLTPDVIDWFNDSQREVWELSKDLYDRAISVGIAKEQARFLLPLNTSTTLYMTGNIRNWIHYIQVRTDPTTQLEHREIAEECKKILTQQCPNIAKALGWTNEQT